MPKVDSDYIENKRNEILNAAYGVCMRKPLYEVSMRDIISESGLSQGGIYRYYSNIDDIYINLINQRSTFYNVELQIENIIAETECPEEVIYKLFLLWKKVFLDNLMGIGKIYYELCTLYANSPDKLQNFILKNTLSLEQSIFEKKSFSYVIQKINEGYFAPKIPFEDSIQLLVTSFDGIIRDLILSNSYKIGEKFPMIANLNGDGLIKSLCVSFILLLDGDVKLINKEEFYNG